MTTASQLPAILCFPDTKQNSISMERALKQAIFCLDNFSFNENYEVEENIDQLNAAIDDLNLMLGAIQR